MPSRRLSCPWCHGRSPFLRLKSPRCRPIRQRISQWANRARPGLAACLAAVSTLLWSNAALQLERAALALHGDGCRPSQQAIVEVLMRLDGIPRVETDVIPDHVLIDYDGSRLKEKALADIVNELSAPHGRCRAAVMES